jgi:ribosomal RNA assembly protein
MKEFTDYVLIPKERIAVLIGKAGAVRKGIEKRGKVSITIDSESGEVAVTRKLTKDPSNALIALDIIRAVARGFSPQKAYKLWSPNIYLETIDLTEFLGPSGKALERVRARLIGREGKVRNYIARLTSVDIVIYGKTVSILGEADNASLAKEAMFKIIEGLPHNAVFKFLESRRM